MPGKVWDETTYPFLNFNGCTVEVYEWISIFIPHFICWLSGVAVVCQRCRTSDLGSVPGLARTRPREIIPANNCTMQGQNNCGNWGSPGVMKLWVAWEVLRWLMKFPELCSGGFHPKLVTPPYHSFLKVNIPQIVEKFKTALSATQYKVPIGKHNNRQHAYPHHEVATDVKQMAIRPIIKYL